MLLFTDAPVGNGLSANVSSYNPDPTQTANIALIANNLISLKRFETLGIGYGPSQMFIPEQLMQVQVQLTIISPI